MGMRRSTDTRDKRKGRYSVRTRVRGKAADKSDGHDYTRRARAWHLLLLGLGSIRGRVSSLWCVGLLLCSRGGGGGGGGRSCRRRSSFPDDARFCVSDRPTTTSRLSIGLQEAEATVCRIIASRPCCPATTRVMLGIHRYYSCLAKDWAKLRKRDLWGASLDVSEIVFLGSLVGS